MARHRKKRKKIHPEKTTTDQKRPKEQPEKSETERAELIRKLKSLGYYD